MITRKRHNPGPFRRRCWVLAVAVLAAAAPPARAGAPVETRQLTDHQRQLCAAPIARAERRHAMPGQLLAAVALAESGRTHGPGTASFAWPWTVTSGADSRFFPTREAAIRHTRALLARGVTNIDVGCMQVNLGWHGRAFASLADAFDPETNVAWAAAHLTRLFAARRSWALAVGLYHSATPAFQNRYKRKVMRLWNVERRRAAQRRRAATIAAYRERRARRLAARAAKPRSSAPALPSPVAAAGQ